VNLLNLVLGKKNEEFSNSERLFVFASLFLFIFDLNKISYGTMEGGQSCWPHFPKCREWLPLLETLPSSYAHQFLFTVVFLFITLALISVLKNRRRPALILLSLLTAFKFFYHFVWTYTGNHNFEYFHLVPTIAFLINSKARVLGAQVAWVVLYFLAAFVKIDESWIVGSYFSTLELGLPLFPNSSIPFVTQGVLIAECFLSWGLLNKKFHRLSLIFWLIFHVYSVLLVGFFYPVRCVLFLIVLFWDLPTLDSFRSKLSTVTVSLLTLLIVMQVSWIGVPENTRQTLRFEGYGFNMFDSNFQCISQIKTHAGNQQLVALEEYSQARFRCGPRMFLERYKRKCKKSNLDSMEWRLWQSTNGNPFYEIVNTSNACNLEFSLFGENSWIDLKKNKIVGYPRKNSVDSESRHLSDGIPRIVYDTPEELLSPFQNILLRYLNVFKMFYFTFWTALLGYFCWLFKKGTVAK